MSQSNRWLLPAGIAELLPSQAEPMERMRRRILDLFHAWGYELVMPPFVEYLDALLTGTGKDLDLQTFKVTDQLTGRMMGLRSDMTPQVARIDAHHLRKDVPVRLCYLGTVLRTLPDGFASSRSPVQVGAELYGHKGVESDLEVICLMAAMLKLTGISKLHLDLGHVGIFRGLARQGGLSGEQEAQLFDALQRKARSEIDEIVAQLAVPPALQAMLRSLIHLNGGSDVLPQAQRELQAADAAVQAALQDLADLGRRLAARLPELEINYDLAELRGYQYQTGIVFAAYAPGHGQEISRGGRYDDIGAVFGRARPATGFSADLKLLLELGSVPAYVSAGIYAPCADDAALQKMVDELRAKGERVVHGLPGQVDDPGQMGCNRRLVREQNRWLVRDLTQP